MNIRGKQAYFEELDKAQATSKIIGNPINKILINDETLPKIIGTQDCCSPEKVEVKLVKPAVTTDFDNNLKKSCCTCKKSNCLKLYCICFKNNVYCEGDCECISCLNCVRYDSVREKSIIFLKSKRKKAFTSSIQISEFTGNRTHIYGCNCKNSFCSKNYCECFRNKAQCSVKCNCRECSNSQQVTNHA